MIRLALVLHAVIGTTLMGIAVVIALVTGHDTLQVIGIAALVGFLAAIPASLAVARQIS